MQSLEQVERDADGKGADIGNSAQRASSYARIRGVSSLSANLKRTYACM
jgi:hypothetical protein